MRPAIFLAALLTLADCAPQQYVPGPNASAPPGVAQGNCKLMALTNGAPSGTFAASGSPKFVAAAAAGDAVGSAIGSAIRQKAIYDACMEATGYLSVAAPSTPIPPAANTTAPAPIAPASVTPMPAGPYRVAGPRACRTEILTYCGTIEPGHYRIDKCLSAHADSLSAPCKAQLAEIMGEQQ